MLHSPDLYLGTFLVFSGFALSLLNLRRIVKRAEAGTSTVLLSENLLLVCIGLAFISRAVYEIDAANIDMANIKRSSEIASMTNNKKCDFKMVLMSYGPLIVSLVNSFLSLIIDNYMHYRMIQESKTKDDQNEVQEIGQSRIERKVQVKNFVWFWKNYFTYIAVTLQWLIPALTMVSMYPVGIEEKIIPTSGTFNSDNSCMTMLEMSNQTCYSENNNTNFNFDLHKYVSSPTNYIVVNENESNNYPQIDSVIKSVYKILNNVGKKPNHTDSVTLQNGFKGQRSLLKCFKMCFIENRRLLIYMFLLAVVSYFVPITISTIILTKIHLSEVKKANVKMFVTRELTYNILFWTPVMFDTFLSLLLCSFTMNGTRTSLFNVVANIYQVVKNFMNTKYFKDNAVVPL